MPALNAGSDTNCYRKLMRILTIMTMLMMMKHDVEIYNIFLLVELVSMILILITTIEMQNIAQLSMYLNRCFRISRSIYSKNTNLSLLKLFQMSYDTDSCKFNPFLRKWSRRRRLPTIIHRPYCRNSVKSQRI